MGIFRKALSQRQAPTPAQPAAAYPWEFLRNNPAAGQAVSLLDHAAASESMTDIDLVRVAGLCHAVVAGEMPVEQFAAEVVANGPGAGRHVSGLRALPNRPFAAHKLAEGRVRIGTVTAHPRNAQPYQGVPFGVGVDALRTSMVIIGPPGSGKTRSFALPIVEHLVLQTLANRASLLVMDPKGSDFDLPDWFDYTIDPLNPTCGFSLYGGSDDPGGVADRLADALMPSGTSADKAYFIDSAKNALYCVLGPFQAAYGRWPTVRELIDLIRYDTKAAGRVRAELGRRSKAHIAEWGPVLDRRGEQVARKVDPASGLVERLALLDRPALVRLFDDTQPRFEMRQLNQPVRVRVVLPESQMPDASRFLARLITSQFIQVTSDPNTNRSIFKGFVCDESGPFVDQYVARAVQKVRSNNAGLVLLAQSVTDFDKTVLPTLLGSVGCRALFGGSSPEDAETFSALWGTEQRTEITRTTGASTTWGTTRSSSNGTNTDQFGVATGHSTSDSVAYSSGGARNASQTRRVVETAIWSPGELVNQIPPRHCILSLASSTGTRTPPLLVDTTQ